MMHGHKHKKAATVSRELRELQNSEWYSRSMLRDAVRATVAHDCALDSKVKDRVRTPTESFKTCFTAG